MADTASTRTTGPASKRPFADWQRTDWWQVAAYTAVLLAMHVIGFGLLLLVIVPAHLEMGARTFGFGLGVTAYVFGLRHAFDADHIAAIDNTTRKLMADGQRPKSVGFWFAQGHSAMVFILTVGLAIGAGALRQFALGGHQTGVVLRTLGTLTSASFLYLIGLVNLTALIGIWRLWQAMRHGPLDEEAMHRHLDSRGLVARLLRRFGGAIRAPWHMAALGVLFGLGFDTASEVALLVIAGTSAAAGLPLYAILVLPLLFAAGMSTLDFADGLFMSVAYEWAFATPLRRIYYNLAVTGLSVGVALIIGSIELASLLQGRLGPANAIVSAIGSVNLADMGFIIVGVFVFTWASAVTYWRVARVEERWAASGSQL